MGESEIKVNETHICVLKRNIGGLYVDYYPLNFDFIEELSELKRMAMNSNRNSYEMEEFINNSPLNVLLGSFNYCHNLSNPFQGISSIKTTDYLNYKKKIDNYKTRIEIELKSKFKNGEITEEMISVQLDEQIQKYKKYEREKLFEDIYNRITPYLLDKAYKSFGNQKDILAFSHRRVGWSFPKFKLSDEFEVIFKSNFGYGASSYFFTHIRYKEIDILPFSDWIRYRFAEKTEIIRYTRRHSLDNESWRITMDFTSELFNYSLKNPNDFINKWIINECVEMVSGLEELLNMDKNYKVLNSFFNKNSETLMGLDFIDFKGEKISGALTFLSKIKELILFSKVIPSLIERVLNCNLSIYHNLDIEIIKLNKKIEDLESQIDKILPNWKRLNEELNDFNFKSNQMFIQYKILNPQVKDHQNYRKLFEDEFNSKYPRYIICNKEFETIDNEYSSLKKEIIREKSWRKKFCSYRETIEVHFKSIDRPLFNQQLG